MHPMSFTSHWLHWRLFSVLDFNHIAHREFSELTHHYFCKSSWKCHHTMLEMGDGWKKNTTQHRSLHANKTLQEDSSDKCNWYFAAAAAAAKSLQSYPTLCDPIDGSPPGSPSLGFSRQEHWSGLPFPSPMHESEKWKWSRSVMFQLLATPWTAAYQAPLPMGFSRQEY